MSQKISSKDNNEPAHWIGTSKLRSLDIDDFFKRTQKFDEKQASVTENTTEEENVAEETNDDADEINKQIKEFIKIRKKFLL